MAGGHSTTQVHMGARVGCHVSQSREEILGQLIWESSSLFNRVLLLYFFRVGLCSHTVLPVQDAWRHGGRRIEAETLDRVDRSPRDQQSNTCSIRGVSEDDERLTFRHVASQGAPDLHRTVNTPSGDRSPSDGRCKLIKIDRDRTAYLIDIGRLT